MTIKELRSKTNMAIHIFGIDLNPYDNNEWKQIWDLFNNHRISFFDYDYVNEWLDVRVYNV